MKIAITTTSFAQFSKEPLERLTAAGYDIVYNSCQRKLTEDECVTLLDGCIGVIAGTESYNASVLNALPALKVISRCGTGTDAIDMPAAHKHNIQVLRTPDAPTQAVAELTLGLMLALLRHVCTLNNATHTGVWHKHMGGLLQGKTVGIIGLGRIGTAVAHLCTAFGAHVVGNDPALQQAPWPLLPLSQLLSTSLLVSLHCPALPGGIPLLERKELAMLPPHAFLLNLARGGLVDEEALYEALQTKQLAGAALDAFSKEPYTGALCGMSNVILTPHCASYATESRIRMETEAVENLLAALQPQKPIPVE